MKTRNQALRAWFMALAVVAGGAFVVTGASARADEPAKSKDDALEDLLKKVEDKAKPDAKTTEPKKETAPAKPKPDAKPAPAKPKAGEDLSNKDKDLDSLLEKLGTTEDKRAPDDKKPPGGGDGPPKPDQPGGGDKDKDKAKKPDPLAGKDKDIDDHIAELAGRRKKKDDRKQSDESSPLSDVIKQMREVEQKLGQEETGEETRQKQSQIVKRLDKLIEEMRASRSQSRSRQRSLAMGRGQKPGQPNDGQNPGSNGGNAPFAKPEKPNNKRSLAGGKDEWGHLPPELRQEMDNVMHEEALPSREELVRRYYLSVSKKSLKRGEPSR